jgi:putative ABC transport system substrate-binding protein
MVAATLLVATALPAPAQEPRGPRIGVLAPRTPADGAPFIDAFLQALHDLGWEHGKNVVIDIRWAHGRQERLPALAAELVRRKVDIILAATTTVAVAASKATSAIPIVVAVMTEPERLGFAATLSRPARNITGVTYGVGLGTIGKQLELIKELRPKVSRVAVLKNPANPVHALSVKTLEDTARSLRVQLRIFDVSRSEDLDTAFAAMRDNAEAVVVVADSLFGFHRARLQDLAARARLPVAYGTREHAEAGGLLSYGADVRDNFRRCASYVDKILKGAKPADLPIEQPTKFELLINLKTAKALGIVIPPSLLARADQLIE